MRTMSKIEKAIVDLSDAIQKTRPLYLEPYQIAICDLPITASNPANSITNAAVVRDNLREGFLQPDADRNIQEAQEGITTAIEAVIRVLQQKEGG